MLDVCGCQHAIATPIADVDQTHNVHKKINEKDQPTNYFQLLGPPRFQDDARNVRDSIDDFHLSLTRGFQKFVERWDENSGYGPPPQ